MEAPGAGAARGRLRGFAAGHRACPIARGKAPGSLSRAVENAGGEAREYPAPRPWELPKWCIERSRELDIQLSSEAAKKLVALVGTSQQRLSRELEKLAVPVHAARNVAVDDVERFVAGDRAPQAYDLADALIAGRLGDALALAEQLKATASGRGGSCSRSFGGCARCTAPP